MTRTLSIAIKENIYQELKQMVRMGKISSFVNQAVEKELKGLAYKQRQAEEQLRKQLITGYQNRVRNERLQTMLQTYGEISWKDLSTKLGKQAKKDAK